MANLQNGVRRLQIGVRRQLALWCLSSQRHFGALTVKFSLNPIKTKQLANLEDTECNGYRALFPNIDSLLI